MRILNPMPARRPGRDGSDRRGRLLALRDGAGRLRRVDCASIPSDDREPQDNEAVLRDIAALISRKKH
jgi:hypothetical protein